MVWSESRKAYIVLGVTISERILMMLIRWAYPIVTCIVIAVFSALYILSNSPWCFLPIFLVVGDFLRTMNDAPEIDIDEMRLVSQRIEEEKEEGRRRIRPYLKEEVTLFIDFIKEEEFKI